MLKIILSPTIYACILLSLFSGRVYSEKKGEEMQTNVLKALSEGYQHEFQSEAEPDGGMKLVLGDKHLPLVVHSSNGLDELLARAGVVDMFHQVYPLAPLRSDVEKDFDPGRVRNDELFRYLYGSKKEDVVRNLVEVDFFGHKLMFNQKHGAAEALRRVSKDLERLIEDHPEWKVYTKNIGGTFAWRTIAGTNRLSAHSYGVAIDLQPSKGRYWRWDSAKKRPSWESLAWPEAIVAAFEKHGFIWGGKWWHYDTFHFEYRPELIAYGKLMESIAADKAE